MATAAEASPPSGESSPPQKPARQASQPSQAPQPPQAPPRALPPPPLPPPQAFCGQAQHRYQQVQQVQQSWTPDGFVLRHSPDIPPICSLLHREADAWMALLALHPSTVSATVQLAKDKGPQASVYYDEKAMNSDSREAAYCAALSALASQCDNLYAEVLKLRNYRKARRQVEVECVREVLRGHADEVLAIGQTLASNGALNVASATAELRAAIQMQRGQVSQLRTLIQAAQSAKTLPLPPGATLVVGVLDAPPAEGDAQSVRAWVGIDKLISEVYDESRELNESSLASAVSRLLCVPEAQQPAQAQRQFARRPGERGDRTG